MSGMRTPFLILSLLALLVTSSPAVPVSHHGATHQKRAGVSGTVISPAGGTSYTFITGLTLTDSGSLYDPHGMYGPGIYVAYQGVLGDGGDNSVNSTASIDLTLHDPTGTIGDIHLATRLASSSSDSMPIEAYFTPPSLTCGRSWQLVFTEHQVYNKFNAIDLSLEAGYPIQFQSAAPTIYIECNPWDAALAKDLLGHKDITHEKRAGVSGTVISPAGGSSYTFFTGMNPSDTPPYDFEGMYTGVLPVTYQGVSPPSVNFTTSISVTLVDALTVPGEPQPDITLAYRWGSYQHNYIDAFFVPPRSTCGYSWQLVVDEYQEYFEYDGDELVGPYAITFRSAAPTIYIECHTWPVN